MPGEPIIQGKEPPKTFNGLTIIKPAEAAKAGSCIAIYGPAGVGKTTLAAGAVEAQDSTPVLHMDAEGGASAISHISESKLSIAQIKSWSEVDALSSGFSITSFPWKTIIFDNITEYAQLALIAAVGNDRDQPQIQHYGKATRLVLSFVRKWRDIARYHGINVVLIVWDSREKDESTGKVSWRVNFTPSLQNQFPGIVDSVGYLSTDEKIQLASRGGEYLRWLDFSSNPRYDSKFRRAENAYAKSIPLRIPDPNFADILDVLRGYRPWPKDKYDKLYQEITKKAV